MEKYKIKGSLLIDLYRSDLNKDSENLPINKITLYCFKSTSLSLKDMREAEMINFNDDDGEFKQLKSRH